MLPSTVHFEGKGFGRFHYRKDGFRPPRKGEFYLSGAVVQAYRAPNDLSASYQVVVPPHRSIQTREGNMTYADDFDSPAPLPQMVGAEVFATGQGR